MWQENYILKRTLYKVKSKKNDREEDNVPFSFLGILGLTGIIAGIVYLNRYKGDKDKQKACWIFLVVGIILFIAEIWRMANSN